jgi:hypothetical protein
MLRVEYATASRTDNLNSYYLLKESNGKHLVKFRFCVVCVILVHNFICCFISRFLCLKSQY